MPDRALVERLAQWADHLAGDAEVDATASRWRCVPHGADALPIEVRFVGDDVEVAIGEWSMRFDADDVEEVAELVAAALFGRVRAEVQRVGERWIRWSLQFRCDDRWSTFAELRRTHLAIWKRTSTAILANDLARPPGLELGAGGGHPKAPWIGTLARAHAEHAARELPLDGEIDLHPFPPKEVAAVVREYIDACRDRGVLDLRIVHGKGIGELRRTVHALLATHAAVESYRLGGHGEGSWGATIVRLRPP